MSYDTPTLSFLPSEIDCGHLPTPDKAEKVMQTHTRISGFVRFKCYEIGYEIIGSEMRNCLETGFNMEWITTSCKSKYFCVSLNDSRNGKPRKNVICGTNGTY